MNKLIVGLIVAGFVFGIVALCLFVSTIVLMISWNYVANTFTIMPKIGFWTSLAMVFINSTFWSPLVVAISNRKSK